MNSEKKHIKQVIATLPPLVENEAWKAVPRDQQPMQCERFDRCGEDARWTAVQGNVHVCDYHRFVFEILRIQEKVRTHQAVA